MIDKDDDEPREEDKDRTARRKRRHAATVRHPEESKPSDALNKPKIWFVVLIFFGVILLSIIGSALKFQQHRAPPANEEINLEKAERATGASGDYVGNSVSRGDRASRGSLPKTCSAATLDEVTTAPNATMKDAPGDQLLVCISDLDNHFRFVRLSEVQGIELEKMQRAAKLAEGNGGAGAGTGARNTNTYGGSGVSAGAQSNDMQPQKPRSLLVLSFDETKPGQLAQTPPTSSPGAALAVPHTGETLESLLEKRRVLEAEKAQAQAQKEASEPPRPKDATKDPSTDLERTNRTEESFKPIIAGIPCKGDPMCIVEGDTIPCTLENRIDASFSGPVKCIVSEPVLSHNREDLLRPGSVILGTAAAVGERDQRRIVVGFHRIIRDDYQSFTLPQSEQGLDLTGAMGLPAHIRRDWAKAFGITLLMGSAAALQVGNSYSGYGYNAGTQIRNGYSTEFARQAQQMFPRNNLPVLTYDEGGRISVYMAHDAGPFKRYLKRKG